MMILGRLLLVFDIEISLLGDLNISDTDIFNNNGQDLVFSIGPI